MLYLIHCRTRFMQEHLKANPPKKDPLLRIAPHQETCRAEGNSPTEESIRADKATARNRGE